jgi:predicted HicB family RNase H-like nuclease
MMEYKGYVARVEFDESANVFHGQVINLRDVITFEGESVTELQAAFQESVDDYLEFCASRQEDPEKPFSGKFLVRIDPDVHRRAALAAGRAGESLNVWVGKAISTILRRRTM